MDNQSRKLLWPDEETWIGFCRDAFCKDPNLAEQAARIWYVLLEHLSHGPEGLRDARLILKQGLRITYPFTSSCLLAYRHYRLFLSGKVDPMDEPSTLLAESIERARDQIANAKKSKD